MIKTGSEIFVECLLRENVDILYGIPGGQLIPIFDKIYGSQLKLILTRHEQGAAHMADGYARSTGKTGVCIATSGPGATNLVTGLANAYLDSIPMVAFTGQVPTTLIGNDAFQEADITGITRPVTKHNYLVKDVKDLATVIREAFYIASTGRPGPVLVDIPADVQRASTEFIWPEKVSIRSYRPNYEGHPGQIKKAAELINSSKRPVLYVGGGVITSESSAEVIALAKKAEIPVTTTLLAIGAFPPDSELCLGMPGMHGTYFANHAIQNSDLLIAVGSRFDDRVTGKVSAFAPHARIIHIDIDPTSISKNVVVDVPVVGDAKSILLELNKEIKKSSHGEWISQINKWKKAHPITYQKDAKLRPQYVIEAIDELTKGEAIVVTEVGQHQMWAAQFYKAKKPRTFLSSGGLGTMGFGLPAAIGAKMANPDKIVVDISGDGSFQMNVQELATAVLNKVNIKVAILNNQYLGMVRQWQEMFYGKRYSATCLHRVPSCPEKCSKPGTKLCPAYTPDFVKLAEAYGAVGIRISTKKDVVPALKKALAVNKPVILEFMVEQEENVLPMVPAGAALDEIITNLA
ncbi:MAG: acetolactate synthase, large subunit, biosynthetic type [Elusimicrobia bacterium RIFOXYB12_FULL_50_12]|nr:MAG: acetolactate synthase, large subunit, biosynthetic type [Elusimicrobia bacterium RIFOXYA12_FULL_49_49]OGS16631.1 MAG: acetolactate synthase, large subunit, biosynthetic type [Elusimicrobia bacterium RIFOXYA2_FULL_47_53]OGS25480.1 MAG: acetolactate synthase, large subunit, biosynthetic type [Elusimicrobia bacterium RIFOXYB12_FULL_50_12]OGS31609.1 MAG: acetolactate synthase, large subunit, biosynthetic type [Elusimicrobia bacterium RIFOXYB2_FULL_46_23]